MQVDLPLLERWLTGWSLSRGLPVPTHAGDGLVVEVGWPNQLRRHVFADAGPALRECASRIDVPFVHLKAPVDTETLRRALPDHWEFERQRYVMHRPAAMEPVALPAGYVGSVAVEGHAYAVRFADANGEPAASGLVVLNKGTAVFDRIETFEPHRRKGLGTALMSALDALAVNAAVSERLLIATDAGRALYLSLGWQVLAPYSTAVSPAP
jgi:GNAT superfamily N-acetyltransferase